ncbi:nuclear transport factor 2 family protein [Rhodopseudomonas sp. HC1]|uniref:nuclear transport factor 2 family protein n=1 Tax=Rhodopseudomonas infernalis TaxID=2897386 RepID=UPI001EE79E2A|nr:nuclear transport factor 2 family protein [Rhodopseudomonas infernalis]MCG6206479.1 nuclear transport factor 2 family protein [Rhodopseudomonas infernalis]
MSVLLPAPIAAYFDGSNDRAPQAVAAAFTLDGEVHDEGQIHRGRDAIAAWKRAALDKYRMQMVPLKVERSQHAVVVTASVAGDFPGSPLQLNYRFGLDHDGIKSLQIGA